MITNVKTKAINILLVDDDKVDRQLVKLAFAKSSQSVEFNVETAQTLQEAVEHLGSNNYDIILLDLGLPDSSGIETVQKAHTANPNVPIVVLTGLADEEMGLEAIKQGAEDYVTKGKSVEFALVRIIRYALERKQIRRNLQEHIKRLNCLYGLSHLFEQPKISLEQIFQESANLIRNAYRYSDITCVRVTFNGIHYKTDSFKKSELSQYAQIMVHGEKAGTIEVYYIGERKENDPNPFLEEERDLLDAVAERLGSIAERKKTADEIQLFRNLIKQSNDCIFVLEPKWGRFLDFNDRAYESLGYTRKELLDMSIKDIDESIPDDSSWQEQVEELKHKVNIIKEAQHKRKDGTTYLTETSLKLVSQGTEDYIIAVARNIPERKQSEQKQTKLLEDVENANQELREFTYIVSHDLKAPLRGIKTLADWITTDYADKLDDEGKEQMNLLINRVDRMHNLLDGILQFSRIGRVQEQKAVVNLNELVSGVIEMLPLPENITITVENEMPTIKCERTRIVQVFQNLLSNAVKYMDKPQGKIKISCVEENGFWKFGVTDNGPGIEEKYFERIFKMFQTLLPRDEHESTGAGLTIAKKIVELFGGRIWVESEVGNGSTFFFTFPTVHNTVKKQGQLLTSSC